MKPKAKYEQVVNRVAMLIMVAGVGFAAMVVVAQWIGRWFGS